MAVVSEPRPRAVVYTDFDGVLNAFAGADGVRASGGGGTFRLDGEAVVPAGSAAYTVRWSHALAADMAALARRRHRARLAVHMAAVYGRAQRDARMGRS
ncbi:hypothetical protein [Bifidobacterium castoris]|uniref:hypothetical protein n=1 Tax=Bifidobacterium castoris TaxID=2306972 RepID=UPI0013DD9A6E|nr:hypothetical protein [Bifidobacterium castoris]